MELLEPHIRHYSDCLRAQVIDQRSDVKLPEHSLVSVHMILAGFAIENLCKGYLAPRLSPEERERVKAGFLPKSLHHHRILKLVERTGIARTRLKLSKSEKNVVERIEKAVVWRGRYPSAPSHEGIRPLCAIRHF